RFLRLRKERVMFKKFSRKSVRFFAIACLTLAAVCLWGAESGNTTAILSANQQWNISSNEWSILCVADWSIGVWSCGSWSFGGYTFSYHLPFNAWKSFYLYNSGGYLSEAVHLNDQSY